MEVILVKMPPLTHWKDVGYLCISEHAQSEGKEYWKGTQQ